MSTSKLQKRVSELLSIHLGKYTVRENIRPDWLTTKNGDRLELDFFIDELDIAIEVQGDQHYRFVEFFHENVTGYIEQVERDKQKRKICDLKGIKLIEIDSEAEAISEILSLSKDDMTTEEIDMILSSLRTEQDFHRKQLKVAKENFEAIEDFMNYKISSTEGRIIELVALKKSKEIEFNESTNPDGLAKDVYDLLKRLHKTKRVIYSEDEFQLLDRLNKQIQLLSSR